MEPIWTGTEKVVRTGQLESSDPWQNATDGTITETTNIIETAIKILFAEPIFILLFITRSIMKMNIIIINVFQGLSAYPRSREMTGHPGGFRPPERQFHTGSRPL
ncbi:MAG TPA: hypothetical protein VMG30_17185 [Acidobacteriota bacterium]|nr:hypothetical protein [Acidobacteriota bacterium]